MASTWDVNRQRPFVGFCRFLSVGFVGFWTYRNLQIYFSEPTILSVFVGFFVGFRTTFYGFHSNFSEKNSTKGPFLFSKITDVTLRDIIIISWFRMHRNELFQKFFKIQNI